MMTGMVKLTIPVKGESLMLHRAMSVVVVLSMALTLAMTSVGAAEKLPEARIEATIPRYGYFMAVGFAIDHVSSSMNHIQ
jgi:hypothetical protein